MDYFTAHSIKKNYQPSGHFHEDENSVTISYNNIPIIIDPGSYCYTSNAFARNLFRSQVMHNGPQLYQKIGTNFVSSRSYTLDNIDLFQLPENLTTNVIMTRSCSIHNTGVRIEDTITTKQLATQSFVQLNFIFHPDIELIEHKNSWIIKSNSFEIICNSNARYSKKQSYYAKTYGQKEVCWSLSAQEPFTLGARYWIELEQITH